MTELNPCPVCGGKGKLHGWNAVVFWCQCVECGSHTLGEETAEEAIWVWNNGKYD